MKNTNSNYCLAKNRQGSPCKRLKAKGKKRCYMHGGAKGSGAPKGNKNALKHGRYTAAHLERKAYIMALFKQFEGLSWDDDELEDD